MRNLLINCLLDDYAPSDEPQSEELEEILGGAYEEVVADSMEQMLSDGRIMEKLAKLKAQDQSLWQKIKDYITELVGRIRSAYKGMSPDSPEGRHVAEMVEAAEGLLEKFQDAFYEGLVDAGENFRRNGAKADGGLDTEVKRSVRDAFYNEFDAWDKKDPNVKFVTGTTSDVLKSVGMKDQEIVLRSGTVLQKIKTHPEMTFDIFTKIPELLEHPVVVQFSDAIDPKTKRPKYDSSITVLGELYADVKNGTDTVKKPVLVSLELLPTNQKKTAVLDFAIVKSAYSKNALQQYLNENSILYIDPDKKRTDSWLSLNRLQLPLGENRYGSIRRLSYVDGKVKVQNPKNMTAMQMRLFEAGIIDEFGNKRLSTRDPESVSNRSLLANALESVAQTDLERKRIQEYKENIDKLNAQEQKLSDLKRQIKEKSFAKGPRDKAKLRELKDEAIHTANRIDNLDKKLLRLEAAKPLQAVLKRERRRKLEEMQEKYGIIRHGEKAVRDDSLPVSTDGKNKVSLVARTVKGAGVTTDEFADLIDEEVVKGGLSYIPLTNDKTTQRAREWLEKEGWEDALRKWHDDVVRCKSGADMVARGAVLLNNAAQAGDKKAWKEILYDYQFLGTTTAQGLQASRILKQLLPEDKLYMAERSIEQMVEDMHLQVDIKLNEELIRAYKEAKTEEERDAIMAQIQQDVADQIPSTFMDKWTALRYVNMLGNLRTQGRNVIGNVAMMATTRLKNVVAAGLEQIAYKASRGKFNRTKVLINDRALLKAAKQDFSEVEALVLDGGKYNDQRAQSAEFAKAVLEKRRIFKNKWLEKYRTATNWAMDKGDVIFSKAAYAHALANYLQAHGVKGGDLTAVNPALLDDARVYAVQQAQEATFRDTNTLSGWVSTLGRKPTTPVVGRVLSEGTVPFRKTPANMLVRAEEYSPMGILNSLGISLHGAMGHSGLVNNKGFLGKIAKSGEQITGAQIVESWAKTITGTGLFALGMLLRNIGVLIGGPDDDEKLDKFEDLNGQQNYALHIGDMYFTVDFLSPSVIPMFMGAQMLDLYQENGFQFKDLESAFTSLADPIVEMSMLQGLNDTLENVQYAENNLMQIAISASLSYLTQAMTNSFLGQLERGFEDSRRSTYVDKGGAVPGWLQSALGKTSAKTPVWDYNQIPFINAWGEEEQNPTVALNLIYNMLSPSYISKETKDEVSRELTRLNEVQSDENVFPSTPEKEYDGRYLTAEEYVALARTQGQTQRQIIEKMVDSSLYDGLPDAYKAKAVSLAYQYAKESAQIEELGREGFSSDWMAEIKGNTAVGIVKHVIKENIKNMYLSGDISADEAIKRRIEYHGDTEDEAAEKVAYWDFQVKNPEYADWNESTVTRYKDLAPETAAHVVDVLGKLNPEDGYTNVRPIQKIEAITGDSKLSDKDKDTALRALMDDKLEAKYDAAREMGIGSGQFALAYRKYQDTEGKGAKAAVVSYFRDTFKISDSKARELYDLFTGKKKE